MGKHFTFNQRDHGKAAEARKADFDKAPKELQQYHFAVSFRSQISQITIPATMPINTR